MTKIIEQVTTGHQTITGTRWPVVYQVSREEMHGVVRWILTRAICNGTAEGTERFATRAAALRALDEYTPETEEVK